MIAIARYLTAEVVASQRYLPPVLLYLVLVAALTDHGNAPILPSFALNAGVLFLTGAWLTIVVHNNLDPVRRGVLTVTARSALRVLLAGVGTALAGCAGLAVLGMLYALAVTGPGITHLTTAELLAGAEAVLACGCTGVAVGTICSSLVIRRTGYALGLTLIVLIALLLIPGAAPVNRILRAMSDTARPAALLAPLAGYLVLGVAALAVATAITHLVAARREP